MFGDEKFDAIFHLASITDTTVHDQFVQGHDNVESFRRLLKFARPSRDPNTLPCFVRVDLLGGKGTASFETNGAAAPANAYAFSKLIMDNFVQLVVAMNPRDWIIVGLRYFNVYGPREAHKGIPASMIYQVV